MVLEQDLPDPDPDPSLEEPGPSVAPTSRASARDPNTNCEVCYRTDITDLVTCSECYRIFHHRCVGLLEGPSITESWFCPPCRDCHYPVSMTGGSSARARDLREQIALFGNQFPARRQQLRAEEQDAWESAWYRTRPASYQPEPQMPVWLYQTRRPRTSWPQEPVTVSEEENDIWEVFERALEIERRAELEGPSRKCKREYDDASPGAHSSADTERRQKRQRAESSPTLGAGTGTLPDSTAPSTYTALIRLRPTLPSSTPRKATLGFNQPSSTDPSAPSSPLMRTPIPQTAHRALISSLPAHSDPAHSNSQPIRRTPVNSPAGPKVPRPWAASPSPPPNNLQMSPAEPVEHPLGSTDSECDQRQHRAAARREKLVNTLTPKNKSDIAKMVSSVLHQYFPARITKEQFTEINRSISREIYSLISESDTGLDNMEKWKKTAKKRVTEVLLSL